MADGALEAPFVPGLVALGKDLVRMVDVAPASWAALAIGGGDVLAQLHSGVAVPVGQLMH